MFTQARRRTEVSHETTRASVSDAVIANLFSRGWIVFYHWLVVAVILLHAYDTSNAMPFYALFGALGWWALWVVCCLFLLLVFTTPEERAEPISESDRSSHVVQEWWQYVLWVLLPLLCLLVSVFIYRPYNGFDGFLANHLVVSVIERSDHDSVLVGEGYAGWHVVVPVLEKITQFTVEQNISTVCRGKLSDDTRIRADVRAELELKLDSVLATYKAHGNNDNLKRAVEAALCGCFKDTASAMGAERMPEQLDLERGIAGCALRLGELGVEFNGSVGVENVHLVGMQ